MRKQFSPRQLIVCVMLMAWSAGSSGDVSAAEKPLSERWFVMRMGGQRVGYLHAKQTLQDNGDIVTQRTMLMKIKRDRDVIETKLISTFTENQKTGLFKGDNVNLSGNTNVRQQFTDNGKKGIDYVISQNGQQKKGTIPAIEEKLLGPEVSRLFLKEKTAKGEKKFYYHAFDPSSSMRAFRVDIAVKKNEDVELFGRVVPATHTEVINSLFPKIVSHEHVDEDGRLVKSVTEVAPGMTVELLLADRALAMAEVDPPELLASSMVTPDKPIRGPRRIRTATYELSLKPLKNAGNAKVGDANGGDQGKWPVKLPTAGFQTVKDFGDELWVHVDLDAKVHNKDDKPTKWHSLASTICDSEDKKIIALVADALKGLKPDSKVTVKADRLRAYVQRYVRSKDLTVGFGHASEVARTRQGDCTEHAVLLAAMLRAAGIPSRGVTGLIYADQFVGQKKVFVYHMWTQAWIEEKDGRGYWMELDATLPRRAFDAAHIALGNSPLNDMADDGSSNAMVSLLPVLGRLEVKVMEVK